MRKRVAIVGGGISGLSTALLGAGRGLRWLELEGELGDLRLGDWGREGAPETEAAHNTQPPCARTHVCALKKWYNAQ